MRVRKEFGRVNVWAGAWRNGDHRQLKAGIRVGSRALGGIVHLQHTTYWKLWAVGRQQRQLVYRRRARDSG